MVFKSVAVYLLDKYLGDYIQNLDAKKLKIDLWQGNVVLEKLDLKSDALANFNIPVTIVSGYLNKLTLHISWNHLYTHPIKITIDGLYLLAESNMEVKYDAEREEKKQYNAKMKEVHKIEEFYKEREEFEKSKKAPKHKDTFMERFKLNLIRNLEVSISNIHIAFEDKITKPDHPFAFGITLNYFKLHTTNADWRHIKVEDDSPIIYKVGEINTLSIYWNSNVEPRSHLSKENIVKDLHAKIVRSDQTSFDKMTYILRPSNINTKLKIAKMPSKQDYVRPVLDAKIDLEEINLNINRDQYSELLDLLELRDYIKLKSKYIKYYTTIETDKPSLRRWKFAYAVIVNEKVRPRLAFYKWENIRANLDRCREYHTLRVKKLSDQASKEEKQRAKELEKQLDILNLVFIRRTAKLEVRKKIAERKQRSWWDKLTNWWNRNSNNTDSDFDSETVMTIDEKKKLYDAIGYEDDHKSSSYPEEYIDISLSVQINLLEVSVWSNVTEHNTEFKVIARTSISDSDFTFKRRPASSAFLVIVDINSLGMYGIAANDSDDQILNDNRPTLIHPTNRSQLQQQKLLHIEFETNPLNTNADYRIQTILQSLEIIYDAETINKLVECFQPDVHHDLKGVKKKVYTISTDIRHRTQFLLNYNLRNIKAFDVDIDIQSPYFLFPENGIYRNDCTAICLDFGRFTVQSDLIYNDNIDEDIFEDALDYFDTSDSLYTPLKVQLEGIRLLYVQTGNDWKNVGIERDSPMHLILPITFDLDIFKCIDVDNAVLPLWKMNAQVSPVESRLSDTRLFGVIKLIRSIPFPQPKKSSKDSQTIEELFASESIIPQKNTKLTFETINNMAPVKKNLQEVHNAEGEINNDKISSEVQSIELEATLNIPRIDLLIKESLSDDTQPFVRISLVSITAQATIKTFDIVFNASLTDLIVVHEQFFTNDKEPLRLLSTAHDEKLISIECLLTSSENPLFYSAPYNSIENKLRLIISKPVAILQMEALLSILRFRNDLILKLPKQDKTKAKTESKPRKDISKISTWQLEASLEQFRAIVGTKRSQLLDIHLQGFKVKVSQSARKTSAYIILDDIRVLDLHVDTRYHKIIIPKSHNKRIIKAEVSLFNYSKRHKKTLNEVDCVVKIRLTKISIVLLYKYVDLILNILNAFKTKKTKTSSTEKSTTSDALQKFNEQTFRIRFDIALQAPTIFIPTNSHSNEGIYINLGKLTLKTHFNRSLVEQQIVNFKNLRTHRVNLDTNDEILGDIVLLKCAEFHTYIDQLLHPSKINEHPDMSVKVEWETIDLTMSKDDYLCLMKIFKENFSEKVYEKLPEPADEKTNQDKVSSNVSIKNPTLLSDDQIYKKIRLDFEIKKIGLVLFLDQSNLTVRQVTRNQNSKFINMRMEMIEAHFQQLSDSSYTAKAQIQNFFFDDLRETNPPNTETRLLDRTSDVDQSTHIFNATIEFQPKNQTNTTGVRQVNVQLESFNLCLSPNLLMALNDFFMLSHSSDVKVKSRSPQSPSAVTNDSPRSAEHISTPHQLDRQSISSERSNLSQLPSKVKSDIETRIDALIKTSKIIWREDQHDANSNCLVLRFALQMRTIIEHGEIHLNGSIKDLTLYICNYAELNDSRTKCDLLESIDIDIDLIINSEEQKFDIRIEEATFNMAPAAILTIVSMVKSLGKLKTTIPDKKEKINSKSLFDPKPFKDAPFWFLEDTEIDQEEIDQTDILGLTTGFPSQKKLIIEENNKQKEKEEKTRTQKFRSQQLTFNMKLLEIKFKLSKESRTKAVLAICLSKISADLKNWSTDMIISSRIHVELALFNDHILSWEPLIDPIVDERGEVVSPWCITCSTITQEDDEHDNKYHAEERRTKRSRTSQSMSSHRNSLSHKEEQSKDITNSLNAKNKIHIRAEHFFSVTLTKTSIDLFQRLLKLFTDAYKKELPKPDDNEDETILSVHNMTGYEILIGDIDGIEFAENNKSESSVSLKHEESLPMTVPGERLSATHLPAIAEQIAKRRQEFSVKIDNDVSKVDINQTWKRVYELGPSSIRDWPIQMLCDSQIYRDRRRIILSSIVKMYNRTLMPLLILDAESIETKKFNTICRLDVNEEYNLPIKPLYMRSTTRLFIALDEDDSEEQINDFISFDWTNETTPDRILKTKYGEEIHFVIYKESIEAYSENTDEPIRTCFDVYIKLTLHLVNLLPIDVQCSTDYSDPINLKPGELHHSPSGNKRSALIFTIPSYNNMKWISESVDLDVKDHGGHIEHIVQFHDDDKQNTLRLALRVDTYQGSYRASLYSPFWILNCTNLKFEFKIENETTLIDVVNPPYFVCPKTLENHTEKKKAYIRLYSIENDGAVSQWSEGFSLHVIKNTGLTSCKVLHDRNYLVCVSIVTSSFGMSKIVTLSPSMTITNHSTIEIEVVEIVCGIEQDDWKSIKPEEIVSFWPRDIQKGIMGVRYAHNRESSSTFPMNDNHRTLLRMNDEDRPALHVEVTVTDLNGIHTVFGDYKIGDAPVLLVNCLKNQPVKYSQKDDSQSLLLPAQHYVYYTWTDPFKTQELFISSNDQNTTVELTALCGLVRSDDENHVFYSVFHDGAQTVLIFAEKRSTIEAISNMPTLNEVMSQYIQISFHEIGISVLNDITQDDLFYITINKCKEIWTETQNSLVTPLSRELNHDLEKIYKTHTKHVGQKKYHLNKHRHVSFNENIAEIVDQEGHQVHVKRQTLDALWIGYAWSGSNAFLHVRINHIQIDDQLDYTIFPVAFHPIISKAAGTDIPGKPFIELSVFKTTVARSKTVHFKYFKLLVQEFVFCADQGLIVSIFAFFKPEQKLTAPTIDMRNDLKRIDKPLEKIVKGQVENQSEETKIYFDEIHLSPLKIHVSFSMHGAKASEQLLNEHPLAEFLLHLLNIAEVQDVILKLNFYKRTKDRFTVTKLTAEITSHYEHQLLKQIHAVLLGLDVFGNPLGVIRGVAEGVESFFYEPYKGAMEGPVEFMEGIASGTEHLVGSAVGGIAGAGSKISGSISKSLATMTLDKDYQSARIQRKELTIHTTSDIVQSGKNVVKDVVQGVKGVVTKPVAGARESGASGFIKGLGKGFLGLVARPSSGVADLTSTSFDVIKRTVTNEEIVHRVRRPRHVGRDGIVRPSNAYAMAGLFIFNRLDIERYIKSDDYLAHIRCSKDEPGWLLATSRHLMFVSENPSIPDVYGVEWHFQYKELNGVPTVKFDPDQIEIVFKESKVFGGLKKDRSHKKTISCQNVGEARYLVDAITDTMHAMEL